MKQAAARREWSTRLLLFALAVAPATHADDAPPSLKVLGRHARADRAARAGRK